MYDNYSHSHTQLRVLNDLTCMFMNCEGIWRTQREPTQTWGEHANSIQKSFRKGIEPVAAALRHCVTPLFNPKLLRVIYLNHT